MPDDLKPPPVVTVPLTESVLSSFARLARGEPTEDLVLTLIADVRRLHQLIVDVQPHVPDNAQTRTMNLPARLKAEVERG
jgi:hypothetical protein